ncbi:MAG: GNAT family N-acetyltransferase [Ferruginibacter sp.]|nr:GNAT family N-acetyltransferase [Cytophagales bacterium]
MTGIHYRPMENSDTEAVGELIKALYREDPAGKAMTDEKIRRTFDRLAAHPDTGILLVFETDSRLIGYALLINFWSNEYGGIVLTIDELYLAPAFRGQGVGTHFIQYLAENRFSNCIALELEVLPYNARARRLYERLGFQKPDRDYLLRKG